MYNSFKKLLILLLTTATIYSFSTLDIDEEYVNKQWTTLNAQLNNITELAMQDNDLSQASLVKIFSHDLPLVKKFNLTGTRPRLLNPKLVKIIFESKYFSRLKQLDMSSTNLDDRAFAFLADIQTPLNSSLEELRLNELLLGSKGFQYLSKINFNGLLKVVQVAGTLLYEKQAIEGLLAILCKYNEEKTCHSELTHLNLLRTSLTRDNFISLIQTINTTSLLQLKLQQIYLHKNQILNQGFNYTAFETLANTSFPNLLEVVLADMDLNDQIASILAKWDIPSLERISISGNPLTDEGVKKIVNKEKTPKLVGLNLVQTDITDGLMKYLVDQKFNWSFLAFGVTKISYKGFSQLIKMNLTSLNALMFLDLYFSSEEIANVLNNITAPNLKQLRFLSMGNQAQLLMKIKWKQFSNLRELQIIDTNIEDSYMIFANTATRLDKLETLTITNMGWSMSAGAFFMESLPTSCPALRNITINLREPFSLPFNLITLSKMGFRQDTYFNLGYASMTLKQGKFYIKDLLVVSYLFYDDTSSVYIVDDDSLETLYKRISPYIELENLDVLLLQSQDQLMLIQIIFKVEKTTELNKLRGFQCFFESNVEDFFEYFHPQMFPHLRIFNIPLLVPGDLPESFVDETLIPLYSSFPQLTRLMVTISFLNEETGPRQMKKLIESFSYPFLKVFVANDQELQVDTLSSFIQKHCLTLRMLELNDNFLEQGIFDLLAKNQVTLEQFGITKVSFAVEEFAMMGRMSTEYIMALNLGQNDLTDEHIEAMLNESYPGPYFPKLQQLSLDQNDIRAEGLQALLAVGLIDLIVLDIDKNNNPQFLNLLLKYPNRVKIIIASGIDVYSLDEDINPDSVHHVLSLQMKTYSFSEEDYNILGKLNFYNLEASVLYTKNIYSCQSLKNFLKINKEAHFVANSFSNDYAGLNSSCLADYPSYSTAVNNFLINDQYSSTYLPQYVKLVTNTTRSINSLYLQGTQLSAADLKIVLSKNFNGVTAISLRNNYLDDGAFRELMDNDLDHLNMLDLTNNRITSESVQALAQKGLPSLQVLMLSQNFLDQVAIRAIGGISSYIAYIDLSGCNLVGTSLSLLKDTKLQALQVLKLDYNQFTQDNILNFVADLRRSNVPSLSLISLKGVSLSKQNFEIVSNILTRKRIQCQLDKPYNIPLVNAAKY